MKRPPKNKRPSRKSLGGYTEAVPANMAGADASGALPVQSEAAVPSKYAKREAVAPRSAPVVDNPLWTADEAAPGSAASRHIPVLFSEVLSFAPLTENARYLDGTLGLGGHSEGLLLQAEKKGLAGVELLGLDRDLSALALAGDRLSRFGNAVHTAHACFSGCGEALDGLGWDAVDFALVDIGVSSMQLDVAERGFSFIADGPLDMRMDTSKGQPASAIVNNAPVLRLKEIIGEYGEDPMAGRIARAIDDARSVAPIERTTELARIVEEAYPAKWRAKSRNHPATRTFQALRMVVNDELGELETFLKTMVSRLRPGGRIAVITFHSLEDRMVKHFFRDLATGCRCSPHVPVCVCRHEPELRVLTRKPIGPSDAEAAANPRAGSAKLRVAEKV